MTSEVVFSSSVSGVPPSTGRWKRYPAYRDSGVEWLGEIPEHWEVKRLKFAARLNMGQSPSSEDYNLDGEGPPFLQGNAEFGPKHPNPKLFCATAVKHAQEGDLLLSVRAPVGAVNIADQRYGIGRGLCALTPERSSLANEYLWYLVHVTRVGLNAVSTGSTYEAVANHAVACMRMVLPPLPEQRAIADFLDREAAKIDALVAKRERLVDLLQEKRAAVIANAVTKGLDPNAPMRDSGIASLGKIPAHWEVRRNKQIFREVDERSTTGEEELLTVSHITGVTPRSEKEVYMFLAESMEGYKKVRKDDLVVNTMWAWMGALGISGLDGIVSPSYNVYRASSGYEPMYLDFLYRTPPYVCEIGRYSKGVWSSRLRLYPDEFFEIWTITAPLSEQKAIVAHIAAEIQPIDALIAEVRAHIDKLREFRMALISAVVTGKIDVREEAA